jgi:hypothetical protein
LLLGTPAGLAWLRSAMQRPRRSSVSAPAMAAANGPGPGAAANVPPTPTGFDFALFTGPNSAATAANINHFASYSRTRPGTSSGPPPISAGIGGFAKSTSNDDPFPAQPAPAPPSGPNVLRKNSLRGKQSFDNLVSHSSQQQSQSIFRGLRRRANSSSSLRDRDGVGAALGLGTTSRKPALTNRGIPPALPDFALSAAARTSRDTDVFSPPNSAPKSSMDISGGYIQTSNSRMLSRSGTTPVNGFPPGGGMMPPPSAGAMQNESNMVHQHIHEMANKRISTLEYLRKAYALSNPPFPPSTFPQLLPLSRTAESLTCPATLAAMKAVSTGSTLSSSINPIWHACLTSTAGGSPGAQQTTYS